ncbi:Integral membrane protein [Acetoanaerobium sticklandii]|uniref:Integral membrane protein n=1 Tax=Acetoanaerobium sticklandii (strain ATCC 12662 / DSM 519 / JCM 1433 / CCUG 9281 / NCIMB 10654 / HF) TaxID=499177 RepID=E3PSZ5_ACESD|nr:YggT family protein [Acetoanaerobium sticklandii]CBH21999.1 Integral membrane protein [Acetoanaerobium sticklandii]
MWAIRTAVNYFFEIVQLLVLIRVILSWVPNVNMYSKPVKFIYNITEPIMEPVREFTARYINLGPIDISPIIVLFLLSFVRNVVLRLLFIL